MTGPYPDNTSNGDPRRRRDQTPGPWRTAAVTPVIGQQIALYRLPDERRPVYLQVPVIAWLVQARHHIPQGRVERTTPRRGRRRHRDRHGSGRNRRRVETADVALANDDLHRLLDVRDLGARAVDVIRENYGMSIAVNAAGLIIGAGGALSPVLAAILHNASSVAVVANSSRLIRYRLN